MKRLRQILVSLLVSWVVVLPVWADDTDIYIRQAVGLGESARPNVLFMLDNSGSMRNNIRLANGTPTSEMRIDVLKQALVQMLNEVHNVNVGLARFAKLIKEGKPPVNAPIMFPVFYIDADLKEVPGEDQDSTIEIITRISNGADDAEENTGSGAMNLHRKQLQMTELKKAEDFKGVKVESSIEKGGDVAMEFLGNVRELETLGSKDQGSVRTSSEVLLLGSDPETNVARNQGDTLIGLRFSNLQIPPGSKIEKALVEFSSEKEYAGEVGKDTLKLEIFGAANDGIAPDKSGVGFERVTNYLSSADNFPPTQAKVTWSITDPVQAGQSFFSEDIASIIQEITGRQQVKDENGNVKPGWLEGNSLVLFFRTAGDSPPGSRGAYGKPGGLYPAPILHLSWTIEETRTEIISGRGAWSTKTGTYRENNFDHVVESGGKQTGTQGYYLGYVPSVGIQDLTDLQKVVNDAQAFYDAKKAEYDAAKGAYDAAKAIYDIANTNYQTALAACEADNNCRDGKTKPELIAAKNAALAEKERTFADRDAAKIISDEKKAASDAAMEALKVAKAQLAAGKKVEAIKGEKSSAGVRFEGLPIPRGADILEAYILFNFQGDWERFDMARASELKLQVFGEKSPAALEFNTTNPPISQRSRTSVSVEWSVDPFTANNANFRTPMRSETTPDLSKVIQEIVNQDDWKSRNSIAFFFENTVEFSEGIFPSIGGYRRFVGTRDTPYNRDGITLKTEEDTTPVEPDLQGFTNMPRLVVKYSAGVDIGENLGNNTQQIVGLRFENVDIPQGATVTNATIDFRSDENAAESAKLLIRVEDTDDALTFNEQALDITSRKLTGGVSWDVPAWQKGATYTTPDLSSLVQTVVNRSGWCGGKGGIAFVVSNGGGEPFRMASSFDSGAYLAPTLTVEYDFDSVPKKTCIWQNYSGQVAYESDDAEEKIFGSEAGDMYLASDLLELGTRSGEARSVGFRFREVPVSSQAKVLNAHLIFTAKGNRGDRKNEPPTKLRIQGEKSGNSLAFGNSSGNISKRAKTAATVNWEPEEWTNNYSYESPDLKEIVQEIITHSDWETYNDMSFVITGSGRRDAMSFKAGPSGAAILRIQVEGYLGDEGEGNVVTVRRRLKKVANAIDIPPSQTPLVDGLYESAQYYRSGDVDYGKTRHGKVLYLVSHPGTYEGGTLKRPKDCTLSKPFEDVCAEEEITGGATYTSPIISPCQSNHIVLLTDGIATENSSTDKIKQLIGEDCDTTFKDPDKVEEESLIKVSKNEACALDLAEYIRNTDNSGSIKGDQTVTTHTIGFQLGKGWITLYKDLQGTTILREDGIYYYEDTKEEVPAGTFIDIKGYREDPRITKSNGEAVKLLKEIANRGGGGFYAAESVEELTAAFKSIVAQAMTESTTFAAPSVSVNRFNNLFHSREVYYALFKPDRFARWDGNVKKYHICQGTEGTCRSGDVLDAKGNLATINMYIAPDAQSYWSTVADGSNVDMGGAGERVPSSATRKLFTYLGDAAAGRNHRIILDSPEHELYLTDENTAELQTEIFKDMPEGEDQNVEDVVNWIRGRDIYDEDADGDREEDRWMMADPLHSSPGIVIYGGSDSAPMSRLFVGTNEGLVRMIDTETGMEKWAFLPKEMLSRQPALMENAQGVGRIYGMDGTPSFWVRDKNGNSQIEPDNGDFVKLYIGMRRGGQNLYALDITGDISAPGEQPKLMWVIQGGQGDFAQLGQTWSRALPNRIKFKGENKVVLLFGGGYHLSQDEGYGPTDGQTDGGGNAIYMVDAETGQRLWWASSSGGDLTIPEMKYPIPSDLLVKDIDANGTADRIYVGDLGGQIWRIDLTPLGEDQPALYKRMAVLGDMGTNERRRFFYPPAMIRISDSIYSVETDYDLLAITSGTRPEPLETTVQNHFYALRDLELSTLAGNNVESITLNDLYDATENVIQQGDEQSVIKATTDLRQKKGWYINLQGDEKGDKKAWVGEKGLASPLILDGKVYFTTYTPPSQNEDECDFSEGISKVYMLELLSAGAAFDVDEDGEKTEADRHIETRSGIASTPYSYYTEDGKDPAVNVDLHNNVNDQPGNPRGDREIERFFWMQK